MARSKTGIHYSAEDNRNGFLFALPWIIGFICFSIIPLATSFYYSFTSFNPVKDPVWVGLDNYKYVLSDPLTYKALGNTLFMAFVSKPNRIYLLIPKADHTKTVKSRKNRTFDAGNASDEECIAGAFSIKKSPFSPSQEPEKTAEKCHSCATEGRKELV